jgi:hypothetical protein
MLSQRHCKSNLCRYMHIRRDEQRCKNYFCSWRAARQHEQGNPACSDPDGESGVRPRPHNGTKAASGRQACFLPCNHVLPHAASAAATAAAARCVATNRAKSFAALEAFKRDPAVRRKIAIPTAEAVSYCLWLSVNTSNQVLCKPARRPRTGDRLNRFPAGLEAMASKLLILPASCAMSTGPVENNTTGSGRYGLRNRLRI